MHNLGTDFVQLAKTLFHRPSTRAKYVFSKKISFYDKTLAWPVSASLWFMVARPCKKFAAKVNGAKTVRKIDRLEDFQFVHLMIFSFKISGFVHLMILVSWP